MNRELFPLEDIVEELHRQGIEATLEYPYYIAVKGVNFGHSLNGENCYSWNSDYLEYGVYLGEVPSLSSVSLVVSELLLQIEEMEKQRTAYEKELSATDLEPEEDGIIAIYGTREAN